MQAIITKYLSRGDAKGPRIKAMCQAGSIIVSWDDALGVDPNHDVVAMQLARKLNWLGWWKRGSLPNDTGNAYVYIGPDKPNGIDSLNTVCSYLDK